MSHLKRRLVAVAFSASTLVLATPAAGLAVTRHDSRTYLREYHQVAKQLGHRAPGRNIVRDGAIHGKLTSAEVRQSIRVLQRMLHPTQSVPASGSAYTSTSSVSSSYTPASSSLESCIIAHESGGNPSAVNGQYEGIGQWSPSSWAAYGGTAYSSTPLGASYAQQEQVLASEGTAGMEDQQAQYDGC